MHLGRRVFLFKGVDVIGSEVRLVLLADLLGVGVGIESFLPRRFLLLVLLPTGVVNDAPNCVEVCGEAPESTELLRLEVESFVEASVSS